MRTLIVLISVGCAPPDADQAGYWNEVRGSTPQALRDAIHDTIDDHTALPYYDPEGFDVREAVAQLDLEPDQPDELRLIYTRWLVPVADLSTWNREHLWPASVGLDEVAKSDLHHIVAADISVNGDRGTLPFGLCDGCVSHPDATEVRYDSFTWQPPAEVRGNVARSLLYMDVRYAGDAGDEPDLELVETGADCDACLPGLSTLLAWHDADPPDDVERSRNDLAYVFQGNRNPFVDNPEWVCDIWGCDGEPAPATTPAALYVTEVHYDNDGTDVDEGVEIGGVEGASLEGWRVVLYNGANGEAYDEVALAGVLGTSGATWLGIEGLQNGDADGIALVAADGTVHELWSWEGTFTAVEGPAEGLTSRDMGAAETSTTELGSALQRLGPEAWELSYASPGTLEPGQLEAITSED